MVTKLQVEMHLSLSCGLLPKQKFCFWSLQHLHRQTWKQKATQRNQKLLVTFPKERPGFSTSQDEKLAKGFCQLWCYIIIGCWKILLRLDLNVVEDNVCHWPGKPTLLLPALVEGHSKEKHNSQRGLAGYLGIDCAVVNLLQHHSTAFAANRFASNAFAISSY